MLSVTLRLAVMVVLVAPAWLTRAWGQVNSTEYPYSYIVFQDAGTTKAKNGHTGVVDFSGASATTVIDAAIGAVSASGGSILLKSGIYSIAASGRSCFGVTVVFALPDGVDIVGEGDSTQLRLAAGNTGNTFVTGCSRSTGGAVTSANVSLRNLTIDGQGNNSYFVLFNDCVNCRVENVKGKNPNPTGGNGVFRSQGCANMIWQNCIASGTNVRGHGFVIGGADKLDKNTRVVNCSASGFRDATGGQGLLTGATNAGTWDLTVVGGNWEGNTVGVWLRDAVATIVGTSVHGNDQWGIYGANERLAGPVNGSIIEGSSIYANGTMTGGVHGGIQVAGQHMKIVNNQIFNNRSAGIKCNCTDMVIEGNNIYDSQVAPTQEYGFVFDAGWTVSGSIIGNQLGPGLAVASFGGGANTSNVVKVRNRGFNPQPEINLVTSGVLPATCAAPYSEYQDNDGYEERIVVVGGSVSALRLVPVGSAFEYDVGFKAGMVLLQPKERFRLYCSGASPSVVKIPQ